MKILILAVGRSGGYNLSKWLSMELGYKHTHEPNDINYLPQDFEVVKELISRKPMGIQYYDKVIGLIRENVRDAAISQLRGTMVGKWHENYVITKEWLEKNKKEIENIKEDILKLNNEVLNDVNVDIIVTYERIYNTNEDIDKIKTFLNISDFKHLDYIDKKFRYRSTKII